MGARNGLIILHVYQWPTNQKKEEACWTGRPSFLPSLSCWRSLREEVAKKLVEELNQVKNVLKASKGSLWLEAFLKKSEEDTYDSKDVQLVDEEDKRPLFKDYSCQTMRGMGRMRVL